MDKKNIALTWGGTGGHIFPLLAVYNYLKDDYNFLWFGEEWNLEEEIANKYNIDFYDISAGKLRRYFDFRNFFEPLKNLTGIVEALYYIKKHNIDYVFSKWGYVSIPMAVWAKLMRKKLFIHESDTVSWISNKIVEKLASKVFYSFKNDKIDNEKYIYSWQILNWELLDKIKDLNIEENKKLKVLVMWGSQWAKNIFETLLKIVWELSFIDFTIILGEKNLDFKKNFSIYSNVKVYDFVSQADLGLIYKKTDIAITRAWATSLWEQNAFWIHSIIVPLKNSAWNHQEKNALYFKEHFESDVLEDSEELAFNLKNKLTKYKDLRKAGLNLDKFFEPLKVIKKELEE